MIRIDTLRETLRSIVEIMVKTPKSVRVTTQTLNDTLGRTVTSFDIDVHESDRGRLIGKHGANMRALRVLLNSAAYVSRARYRVSCNDRSSDQTQDRNVQKHFTNL